MGKRKTRPLEHFLNARGVLTRYPQKLSNRLKCLEYVASKIEKGKKYTEKEINNLIKKWQCFDDYVLIRRELIDFGHLTRKPDGSEYYS